MSINKKELLGGRVHRRYQHKDATHSTQKRVIAFTRVCVRIPPRVRVLRDTHSMSMYDSTPFVYRRTDTSRIYRA